MERKDTPLTVEVIDGVLTISVGVNVVQWAAENMDTNNPWNDELNDFIRLWRIADPEQFAKDVRDALTAEEEDGTTEVILLLDKACLAAIEDGSTAVIDHPSSVTVNLLHGEDGK